MNVYFCICMYLCIHACMYVSMHTHIIVCKYVCMYICMYRCFKMKRYGSIFYNVFVRGPFPPDVTLIIYRGKLELNSDCFKIITCDIPFLRSHEARPGTVPPKPELWGNQHCCPPSQNFGEDSLSLSHLIYTTACKSCITSCLILDCPCQRRLF